jgi:hypothetical protein
MNFPSLPKKLLVLAAAALLLAAGGATALLVHAQDNKAPAAAAPRPALTVTATTPLRATVATALAVSWKPLTNSKPSAITSATPSRMNGPQLRTCAPCRSESRAVKA